MHRFLTVTGVGALVIVGFILYQCTRPLMLPNNPERSQFLYEQALAGEDIAAAIRGLEADGVVVDPINAFYQLNGEGDDAIETIVVLTESEHLVGFAFQQDKIIGAFLAGEDDIHAFMVDLLSGFVARTEVTEPETNPSDVAVGHWVGDSSLAEITTIAGPVNDSPFYGIEFPEGYFDEQTRDIWRSQSLPLDFFEQGETDCDVLRFRVLLEDRLESLFHLVSSEARRASNFTSLVNSHHTFVSNSLNDIHGGFRQCLAHSTTSSELGCQQFMFDFSQGKRSSEVETNTSRYETGIIHLKRHRDLTQGSQGDLIDFLNESECTETISPEASLELSASYSDSETASITVASDEFINNTLDTFAPYVITTTDPSFEVTGYIANGEAVDNQPLILPTNTQGSVEITATCLANAERSPEGIYEGLVIATPPVGEMAFLGIRLQCSDE